MSLYLANKKFFFVLTTVAGYDFGNFSASSGATENKKLLVATVLSISLLFVWNLFTAPSEEELARLSEQKKISNVNVGTGDATVEGGGIKKTTRKKKEVFLKNSDAHVGFDVNNNRITFFALNGYKQHEGSLKNVILLDEDHFVESGWLGDVKNDDIDWKLKSKADDKVVVAGEYKGLTFETNYVLLENYVIEVKQKVFNSSSKDVMISNYSRISEASTVNRIENASAFRGVLLVNDGNIHEFDYGKIASNTVDARSESAGGWIGFSDQYWITALADKSNTGTSYSAKKSKRSNETFQVDFHEELVALEKGKTLEKSSLVVVAPKKLELLQNIGEKHNLLKFDKAIDFGMFYFLSKPLLIILKRLFTISGNFGVAIILLTILVRMIIFPLANRSYRTMIMMKKIAPQMNEIKQQYANDKKAMQTATYQLYKDNHINPMSAIIPLLLQIPIFFALYKVLVISIEMRDACFIGWIVDLSSKDPSSIFNLFGLLNFPVPSVLQIGLLPCLMGLTMFIQQLFNPPTGLDPAQTRIIKFLPLILTIMFASMPAGLVLYWSCSNVFTIFQQVLLSKVLNREK